MAAMTCHGVPTHRKRLRPAERVETESAYIGSLPSVEAGRLCRAIATSAIPLKTAPEFRNRGRYAACDNLSGKRTKSGDQNCLTMPVFTCEKLEKYCGAKDFGWGSENAFVRKKKTAPVGADSQSVNRFWISMISIG